MTRSFSSRRSRLTLHLYDHLQRARDVHAIMTGAKVDVALAAREAEALDAMVRTWKIETSWNNAISPYARRLRVSVNAGPEHEASEVALGSQTK